MMMVTKQNANNERFRREAAERQAAADGTIDGQYPPNPNKIRGKMKRKEDADDGISMGTVLVVGTIAAATLL